MKRDKVIQFLETYGIIIFAILMFLLSVVICNSQTVDQVRNEIKKYDIKPEHVDIILSQSILETGWYESLWCKNFNNIFGLTKSVNGTRVSQLFVNWRHSVRSYYNQIYSRYNGGDYYVFLKELPYAMDPKYISKIQTIKKQIQ